MSYTPNLGLTLMSASQAQKEVVFNEAIIAFDAVFRSVVISITNTPPGSPSLGDMYCCGSSPTGAWSGQAYNLTFYYNGWQFLTPKLKQRIYSTGASAYYTFQGSGGGYWTADAGSTPTVLTDLTDVNLVEGAGIDGYSLVWNNATSKWIASSVAASTLHALTDVTVTEGSGIDGFVLYWNNGATKWEAKAIPAQAFLSLSDVTVGSPSVGDVVAYKTSGGAGVHFISPSSLTTVAALSQVGDVTYSGLTTGSFLQWNGAAWGPSSSVAYFKLSQMADGPGSMVGKAGQILVVNSLETALAYETSATLGFGPSFAGVNTQTISYGLVLSDLSKFVDMNSGSATNLTVPLNATQAFPIDAVIMVGQRGTGAVTIVATGGVTINEFSGNLVLSGQYATGMLIKVATDTWRLIRSDVGASPPALSALTDVSVTEGSGIDGYTLNWNNGASKWEAVAPVVGAGYAPTVNTQTSAYTLVLGDAMNTVVMNVTTTANNLTIPPHASVAWVTGTRIKIVMEGTGITSILAGAGVTLYTQAPLAMSRYSAVELLCIATDVWIMSPATQLLMQLGDVSVTDAVGENGMTLNFNSGTGKWSATAAVVNSSFNFSGLGDTSISGVADQQIARYLATSGKWTNVAQNAVNAQTGTSYTLALTDAYGTVTMNNVGSNTLTIPANGTIPFPVGTEIEITQLGAGATTIAITTDTLDYYGGNLTMAGQYASCLLIKVAATVWVAMFSGANKLSLDSDVTITSAATDDVLTWNGSKWVNQQPLTPITAQTTGYTFVIGDQNTWVRYNSVSGGTYTIPPNSSVAFPVGTSIIMDQMNTGQLTVAAGLGVTLENATAGLKTAAQYAVVAVTKVATDTWVFSGNSSA